MAERDDDPRPWSPSLAQLRPWSLEDSRPKRGLRPLSDRVVDWIARRRGPAPGTAPRRAWIHENAAEHYGVALDGDDLSPDPAREAMARQVCQRMPQLAAKLLDWLERHAPPLPGGRPHHWVVDHLWFGLEPRMPPDGFMVEVQDEADPREPGESGLHIACGWRADRPDDPIVVHGLRWHGQPWPAERAAPDPIRETHSIAEFLRSGRLAGIGLGATRADVERRWGPPVERTGAWDGWGRVPPVPWKGESSIMIGFDAQERVDGIVVDLERHPRGTPEILVAPHVALRFDGYSPGRDDKTLEFLLRAEGLPFTRRSEGTPPDDLRTEWRLSSGVVLTTAEGDDASGLVDAWIERAEHDARGGPAAR